MRIGQYHLDNQKLMAIFLPGQSQVGALQMGDHSLHDLSNVGPEKSDALPLGACFLDQEDAGELSLTAKAVGQINLIECSSMDEVIALTSSRKVSIAVVDIGLSKQWPYVEADRLCDTATADIKIVIVCNGSEADYSLVQSRCQSNPNVIVVMGDRYSVEELFELCMAAIRITIAQDRLTPR